MRGLSLVYAYYRNPGMLAEQYRVWSNYTDWQRRHVELVVVDDGSPERAFDVPRPEGLPPLKILRILEDRPWHQDAARNLGAREATHEWLFLSDMDHVLPAESLDKVFGLREDRFYTLARINADGSMMTDGRGNPKPHPNSYVMRRELYWRAGGYDEDFCGVYGTDGMFRRQLLEVGKHSHLDDVPIIRYSRDVIADASTTTISRDEYKGDARKQAAHRRKKAAGRAGQIVTMNFPWERVL